MKKYKRLLETILLILIFSLTFFAGIYFNLNPTFSILGLVIAVCLHFIRETSQSHIRGNGVRNITASNKEPSNPEKNDLWLDIR